MNEQTRVEIERYLAGDMQPAEAEAFLTALRLDPEGLAYLGQVLRQQSLLYSLHRGAAPVSVSPHRGWRWHVKAALVAAALLLVPLAGWYFWRARSMPEEVAVIEVAGAGVTVERDPKEGPKPVAAGDKLYRPSTLLVSHDAEGPVVVRCAGGARLEVVPGSYLIFPNTKGQVWLEKGEISATVEKQTGAPLVFQTNDTKTHVLGTRFRLARLPHATRVEVDEGVVEFVKYDIVTDDISARVQVAAQQRAVARPATPLVVRPARVTAGLLALYPFDEGGGTIAHDTSGVGTPANLHVGKNRWVPGGVVIQAAANVDAAALPAKVRAGVQQSQEMTLEIWVEWESGGKPQVHHFALTRAASGMAQGYWDGASLASGKLPNDVSSWLRAFFQGLRQQANAGGVNEVTLRLAAIYGRSLTAAEVRQNYDASVE